ncbi:MAG: M48 family metalloprotease, partial [Syntrophales bacterium]|nr:M48 family metalloprotease [Syntrophales bacterium]
MKTKAFIAALLILLAAGCATTTPKTDFRPSAGEQARLDLIRTDIGRCMDVKEALPFVVYNKAELYAAFDGESVLLTEGMVHQADDVLRFVIAHEIAHYQLGHIAKSHLASGVVSTIMAGLGFIIPGAGLLNYVVNPAVVRNFSKSQELDADSFASKACLCMGIP